MGVTREYVSAYDQPMEYQYRIAPTPTPSPTVLPAPGKGVLQATEMDKDLFSHDGRDHSGYWLLLPDLRHRMPVLPRENFREHAQHRLMQQRIIGQHVRTP